MACGDREPVAPLAASPALVIAGVTVIDGSGGEAQTGQTVVVRRDRIESISASGGVDVEEYRRAGARVLDGDGRFLIPGLWDAHAHSFASPEVLDLYLLNGVTSLRDMGCPPECSEVLVQIQNARRDTQSTPAALRPRLLVAGPNIDGASPIDYSGHWHVTPETAAAEVTALAELGSDFVKVRDWLTLPEYDAVVAAARTQGLPVDGHLAVEVPVLHALGQGQRTIEHEGSAFGTLLMACSSAEEELRSEIAAAMSLGRERQRPFIPFQEALSADYLQKLHDTFDDQRAARLIEALAASGTAWVPTLVVQYPGLRSADPVFEGVALRQDERMRFVPADVRTAWESLELRLTEEDRTAFRATRDLLASLVGRVHRAGVPILAGTDAVLEAEVPWVVPGISLHDELLLFVKAGLTPSQAIATATSVPARVFGRPDTGVIAPGNLADLVLLDGDPLADIRNTASVRAVILGGVLLDERALAEKQKTLEAASSN